MKLSILKRKTFFGVGGPYLTVYTIFEFGRLALCVHDFHRGDEDPDCHDHPFAFVSFLLRGSYRELLADGSSIVRRRFSVAYRSATHKHRLELLSEPCSTLCLKIGANREWGFWKTGSFVPWRRYIEDKGLEPIK